jgi:hypothetical protein
MSEKNFGMGANSRPIIIDFMMSNYNEPQTKFYDSNTIQSYSAKAILNSCTPDVRLQIAKESIREWNLIKQLDQTLEQMDQEKKDFNRDALEFEKKSCDLTDFVEKVKSNLHELLSD